MRIALIGWGSLFWNSSGLKIIGGWKEGGPYLPIEFARESEKTPLTLVLFPQASDVQTLWAQTKITDLKEAIAALAKREGTKEVNIGYFSRLDGSSRCNAVPEVLARIEKWTDEKELDAVVWTDLKARFRKDLKMEVNEENVFDRISELPTEDFEKEGKYVTRVHDQIDTKIRRMLRLKFGWRSLTEYEHGFWLDKNSARAITSHSKCEKTWFFMRFQAT